MEELGVFDPLDIVHNALIHYQLAGQLFLLWIVLLTVSFLKDERPDPTAWRLSWKRPSTGWILSILVWGFLSSARMISTIFEDAQNGLLHRFAFAAETAASFLALAAILVGLLLFALALGLVRRVPPAPIRFVATSLVVVLDLGVLWFLGGLAYILTALARPAG